MEWRILGQLDAFALAGTAFTDIQARVRHVDSVITLVDIFVAPLYRCCNALFY
jgi:hypothetical protein